MEKQTEGLGYNNKVALYVVAIFLFLTSLLVGRGNVFRLQGAQFWLLAGGLACIVLMLVSVYITAEPVAIRHQNRMLSVVLSAAFIFACPGAVMGSFIHLSAILLLWAQFCLLKEQYFTAFFFIGVSAMLFPPVMWVAPLVISLMLIAGLTDTVRNLLKFFGGLAVPYILVSGVIYIFGGDVLSQLTSFWGRMTYIRAGLFSLDIPALFFIFCVLMMCVHASLLFLSKMGEYGISESYALKVQIMNVMVCSAIFIMFSSSNASEVALLACCPSAVLLARYFSQYGSNSFLRVEIVLLLCAMVISRLGNLIV